MEAKVHENPVVTIPAYLENMVMLITVTEDIALADQQVMEDQFLVVVVFQELLLMAKNSDLWSQIIQEDMFLHIRIFKHKRWWLICSQFVSPFIISLKILSIVIICIRL